MAGANSSKSAVLFSLCHHLPDCYILCQVSPVVRTMVFGVQHMRIPLLVSISSYKSTLINSVWAICPGLCTSHRLQQDILLWTSLGSGSNARRRLMGSSTTTAEIEEEVVPKGKECEQTERKLMSTIHSHSSTH